VLERSPTADSAHTATAQDRYGASPEGSSAGDTRTRWTAEHANGADAPQKNDGARLICNVRPLTEQPAKPEICGGTMTKMRSAFGFLLAVVALGLRGLRRAIKRLAAPGTGPFLSGV
jgi:hypothetical protein